jgi:alpha-glucosidase (family GH31 glycosyl hydrolase)
LNFLTIFQLTVYFDRKKYDKHPDVDPAIRASYIKKKSQTMKLTLRMIGEKTDGQGKIFKHYDVHNLYTWTETIASLPATRALDNKRSIVISRSQFPKSGSYVGHWLGDNTAA